MPAPWDIQSYLVGIGLPTFGMVDLNWAIHMANISKPCKVVYLTSYLPTIDIARGEMARDACTIGCTHLFFMDTDVIVPKDILRHMLELDLDIVSGVYRLKKNNMDPRPVGALKITKWLGDGIPQLEFIEVDEKPNMLLPVDAVGFGCILIKTNVFREMSQPWFSLNSARIWDGKPLLPAVSEDYFFCLKAKEELGIQTWLDTSVICDHILTCHIDGRTGKLVQL